MFKMLIHATYLKIQHVLLSIMYYDTFYTH